MELENGHGREEHNGSTPIDHQPGGWRAILATLETLSRVCGVQDDRFSSIKHADTVGTGKPGSWPLRDVLGHTQRVGRSGAHSFRRARFLDAFLLGLDPRVKCAVKPGWLGPLGGLCRSYDAAGDVSSTRAPSPQKLETAP